MTDLFVSYKAEDRGRVAPLVHALQEDGFSVWWDAEIGGGEEWREAICKHLDSARQVIVVWSKRSVGPHGNFVRDEATRALRRRAYLPVRIDKVDPPLGFGELQSLDLVGWKGARGDKKYQAVLAAVRSRLGGEQSAPAPPPRKGLDRRTAVAGGAAAAAIAAAGGWALLRPTAAKADSIAVLPFANLSGDPAQAYFSDGIAEELRSALARVAGLKVVGRISSEAVQGEDTQTAARRLSVANILTGSVRQSPTVIRVSAQLLDGQNGIELWSDIYDRAPGNALDVQTDIASNVAQALSFNFQRETGPLSGGTTNPAAHEAYLRGVSTRRMGHDEELFREALAQFDGAIQIDPRFADAYAQKSITLADLTNAFSSSSSDFERGFAEAASNARRAVSLAPDRAVAHAALAEALLGSLDLRGADAEYGKAAATGSSDPVVMTGYGFFLSQTNRPNEGLRAAERGLVLDPLNPRAHASRSAAFFVSGRYEDSIRSTQHAGSLAKVVPSIGLINIGECYMLLGNAAKAREFFSQAPADNLFRLTAEAILAARTGELAQSNDKLARLRSTSGGAALYQEAEILAQQGNADEAFAALDRALRIRDPGLRSLTADQYFGPLRSDGRFKALATRLGFPL